MKFSFFNLFILNLITIIESNTSYGVIEGFYWPKTESINNHYAEYDHEDRRKLLKTMKDLNLAIYIYGPKELIGKTYERAYNINLIGDLTEWKKTFKLAKDYQIKLFWSISPGWLPVNQGDFKIVYQKILAVMKTLKNLGCEGFVLSLDDTPGGVIKNLIYIYY